MFVNNIRTRRTIVFGIMLVSLVGGGLFKGASLKSDAYRQAPKGSTVSLTVLSESAKLPEKPSLGTYSFGIVDARNGRMLHHIFKVRNDSANSVWIQELTASCGCSQALLNRDPKLLEMNTSPIPQWPQRVAPGELVYVRFDLDLNRLEPGVVDKTVWVVANGRPAATLKITGLLRSEITFTPASMELTDLRPNTSRTFTLKAVLSKEVASRSCFPILRSDDTRVRVEATSSVCASDSRNSVVTMSRFYHVTIAPGSVLGPIAAHLRFHPSLIDRRRPPTQGEIAALNNVNALISANVIGDFTTKPSIVVLQVDGNHPAGSGRVQVLSSSHFLLQGLRVSCNNPYIKARIADKVRPAKPIHKDAIDTSASLISPQKPPVNTPGGYYRTLRLDVKPEAPAGPLHATVLLTVPSGQVQSLQIMR